MSPLNRKLALFAIGSLLIAALAVGCSKKRGAPFDPDAGHPEEFFDKHPAAFIADRASCASCHGEDLRGGIAQTSCFLAAHEDGHTCHPGGPGGHPADWRTTHTVTPPAQAAVCASCHDNPGTDQAPNCFDNSLCHGARNAHPANWRSAHTRTDQSLVATCAACHDDPANALPPGCFNASLCHGRRSPHPPGWFAQHSRTDPGQARSCAQCHDSLANSLPPNCFNTSLCHGLRSGHPVGWSSSTQHGAAAKGSPGIGSCQPCHGSDYGGGISGQACAPCHGWSAPHGQSWANGGVSHMSTLLDNVEACAQCHPVARPATGTTCTHNGSCHPI